MLIKESKNLRWRRNGQAYAVRWDRFYVARLQTLFL